VKKKSRRNAIQRLRDAEEFLLSAKDNFLKGRYKACVDNAVDAAIAANDALTIWFIGAVATKSHREAISLHVEVGKKIGENKAMLLSKLLELRHKATYRPIRVSREVAQITLQDGRSFFLWVKFKMKT
jgi:uncharacterized protein (UPF0332 family)